MQMAAALRRGNSGKLKKRVLRKMKSLVKTVSKHALRHRDLLEKQWQRTDWTEAQATQVIDRIDKILLQLPQAVEQAHERIIGGRTVASSEKILSLYEQDVHVIVRGKASAEVEFGNSLLLAEQEDGLIVDWKLHKDRVPNDSRQVVDCIERIHKAYGDGCQSNGNWLEARGIYNGLCPRSPEKLKKKSNSGKFQKLQNRSPNRDLQKRILW